MTFSRNNGPYDRTEFKRETKQLVELGLDSYNGNKTLGKTRLMRLHNQKITDDNEIECYTPETLQTIVDICYRLRVEATARLNESTKKKEKIRCRREIEDYTAQIERYEALLKTRGNVIFI